MKSLQIMGMLWLLVHVSGCANARRFEGFELTSYQQTVFVELPPIAPPSKWQCGYASFASVALYHGVEPRRLLAEDMVEPFAREALSGSGLLRLAELMGLAAFGYQGDLEDLRESIRKGRPVIILLDSPPRLSRFSGPSIARRGHWLVMIGMTPEDEVILLDPRHGSVVMRRSAFMKAWNRQRRLCVVVCGPVARALPFSDEEIACYARLEELARQERILEGLGGGNSSFYTGTLPAIIVFAVVIPAIVLAFASAG